MSKSIFSNKFQLVWVINLTFCHTYHILSAFYFLGVSDFPQEGWLGLQLYAELTVILDLLLRFYIMYFCPEAWESLWLLHDTFCLRSKIGIIVTIIGSFPLVFIVACSTTNRKILTSLPIAIIRFPKLLRFREIWQMSKTYLKSGKEALIEYFRLIRIAFSIFIYTHILSSVWLAITRIDTDPKSWAKIDSSIAIPGNLDLYIDSCYFVVSTMCGSSYGNVLPNTDLEVFTNIFFMFTGAIMYADLFANFASYIKSKNAKSIECDKMQEQAINFSYQLCISDTILSKIRNYYNNLRIKYSDLHESIHNIKQLPTSLSSELCVTINSSLITEIKFFQFSDPMFILSIIRAMTPKLCMANDLVLEVGEIAEEMYFIKKGLTVVFATDNSTIIAYLSEGSYFGEIGILISKVRTVTVKAKTDCMFYVIQKDELLKILELYPDQMAFLKAVGRQRMLTTDPEDLMEDKDNDLFNLIEQNSILNNSDDENPLINISSVVKLDQSNYSNLKNSDYRKKTKGKRYPCNATKQYPIKDKFIVIPFSQLYYIWCIILFSSIIYNLFIIPFTIAFEYNFDPFMYPIDIISLLIFVVDIFFASKTAFNKNYEITTNLEEVSKDYIESRLFFDVISIIPLDYILLIFISNQQFIAFCRIIRLFKFYKIFDYLNVWRKYYLGKKNFWYIILMMVLFVSLVHINACIYYFIGKNEYGKHHRFDGQTLFSDIVNRPFLDFKPVLGMSLKEKYCHFIFLATCTVGCSIFGDVIPFTPIEIIFTIFLTFFSRIFVAFIYAIVSDYISSIYLTYSNHIESNSLVINYLELHNMPTELKKRVNKYYEILWDNFKGMNDDEIMGDLPESIAKQMKLFVFSSFTEKLTIFPKEDKAAITSLLTRLKIRLVPEGEYIIREREIRDCIYFIIRGSVLIVSGGVVLATLEQGAVFGEMAIAEKIPTVRNASAFCITPVCVGSLSIEDFKIICTSYPSFEEKIQIEVSKRKADNLTKTPNVKPVEQSKIASSSKRPSKLVNNFEKSKSAMSRLSKDSSKKGSRQGVYEMEEEKGENRILLNSLQSKFTQNYYEKKQSKVKTNTISEINYLKIQQEDPENQSLKQSVGNIEIKVCDCENPNVPNIANLANDNASNGILHRSCSNNSQNNSLKSSGVPSLDLSHDDIENKIVKETHSNWKWFKIIYRSLLILIQIYNIVFIPLQGGFRIKFSPGLIVMEIFTILLYIIDIFLLIIKYKRIQRKLNKIGVEVNVSNRVVWRTTDADQKELNILKIYFVPSIISCFPFAMIFSFAGVDNPSLLIYFIKITRLMKIWPLKSFLRYLKRNYLKITRVAEVIIIYYIFAHVIACSIICIAYEIVSTEDTWMKRIPYPQAGNVKYPKDRMEISDLSIYIHAINLAVNTLSHVSTGELLYVTYTERIYASFLILFGVFQYAFLFGNITAIVSELAPQKMFIKSYNKYEVVLSSLKVDVVPKKLMTNIKAYFDFSWTNSNGIPIDELSSKLPSCLNTDILGARYSNAIQNCILFKNLNNEIDMPFANSLITSLKFRTYMDGDFIVIGGSHSRNTYIMMEGEAGIFSFRDEFISFMKTGDYYSNDLDSNDEDTFQYKRPVHIVSKGTSIVGVLIHDILNELYLAYPNFKEAMRTYNKNFNLYAKKYLRKYLKSKKFELNSHNAVHEMAIHYSYSTSTVYNSIRSKLVKVDLTSEDLADYNIQVKQNDENIIQTNRRSTRFQERKSLDYIKEIELRSSYNESCFSKFKFDSYSKIKRIIDIIHLLNLLYIALSIPFLVGFYIKMDAGLITLELISLIISFCIILLNFRASVPYRGGSTLKFKAVLSYYFHNGLILDLFGLWPLNLALGIPNLTQPYWIVFPLRIVRCICTIRITNILNKFDVSLRQYSIVKSILKAILFVFIVWHWVACLWSFTNEYIVPKSLTSWEEFINIETASLYRRMLFCYFNIINHITTIGYTNYAPVTDVGRISIVFFITMGDALFAAGFGLLAGIVTQSSIYGRSELFFRKMNSIKELLSKNGDESQIVKVEQYFAYSWHTQKSTDMMVIKELSELLPYRLSKEVVYHCTRELLEPMFKKLGSENLIKDLSSVLGQAIYLPGDFIILKGDIGEEMYFIAEGSVYILAADKRTVLNTLSRGSYFGEMAIFLDSNKRTAYVQAETFCNILILSKKDVDKISENYPSVAEDIKKETMRRAIETKMIEENKHELEMSNNEEKKELVKIYSTPKSMMNQNHRLSSHIISLNEECNSDKMIEQTKQEHLLFKNDDENAMSSRSIIIEESDQESDGNENRKLPNITKIDKKKMNRLRFAPQPNVKHFSQNLQFTFAKRLGYKSKIRKSISADIDKLHNDKEKLEVSLPKHIRNIIDTIDNERKLLSHHNSHKNNEDYASDKMKITDFRREGVLKERRLSRIDLGKQLALSETSGLKLQWMVNFKNLFGSKED